MDVEALVTAVRTDVLVSDNVSKKTLTVSYNDIVFLITHVTTSKNSVPIDRLI
jgi:hypothetical protein